MKIGLQVIKGYAHGAVQPTVALRFGEDFDISPELKDGLNYLLSVLNSECKDREIASKEIETPREPSVLLIVQVIDTINRCCGDLRFTSIKMSKEFGGTTAFLPTLSASIVAGNLNAMIQLLKSAGEKMTEGAVHELISRQEEFCRAFLPDGTANRDFVVAAAERKVPFQILSPKFILIGYGSGSTILSNTVTDREHYIGALLSDRKTVANRFLKLNGFPIAEQAVAKNIVTAKDVAQRIGYPVVIKPSQGRQGQGVYANIQDEIELEECFNLASIEQGDLVVEKHIFGDHYRIDYAGDELIKAVRRRPASVIGNGSSTLSDLIQIYNTDPTRLDPNSSLKPVALNEDLHRMIKWQRVSLEDVPAKGERIQLQSISNLNRGGVQVDVQDSVHPENFKLCRSIASALRLDVVGIDLLSNDLSVPWYSNGAVVCEVNAGPQMGSAGRESYWRFLSKYIRPHPPISIFITEKRSGPRIPIFDSSYSEISLQLEAMEVLRDGCPTQYFNSIEISDEVSDVKRKLLEKMLVSVMPDFPLCGAV